jgi:hypothetical protein
MVAIFPCWTAKSTRRTLGLRDRQGLADHHGLAAADVVRPGHRLLKGALLGRECGDRQPHDQQIDRRLLHQGQGTPQQRQVLRRLGIAVVHLGGAERIGGQFHLGADLVEEAIDRDRDRLASLIAGLARRLAHARVGD